MCGHFLVSFVLHLSKEMKHVLGKREKNLESWSTSHGFTPYGRIGEQLVVTFC